eukprot:1160531-Pelagomonas_calceolata.AAC.10
MHVCLQVGGGEGSVTRPFPPLPLGPPCWERKNKGPSVTGGVKGVVMGCQCQWGVKGSLFCRDLKIGRTGDLKFTNSSKNFKL